MGVKPPEFVIVVDPPPPLPVPGGVAHVPSSRKNRVVPAAAPGSGTLPIACPGPDGPNTCGRGMATIEAVADSTVPGTSASPHNVNVEPAMKLPVPGEIAIVVIAAVLTHNP